MRKIVIIAIILSSILSLCSSQKCNNTLGNGLTQTQKQAILDKHNYYRDLVAKGAGVAAGGVTLPKASNMKKLVWDDTLATVAQNYANTCPWLVHNAARTNQTLNKNNSAVYQYVGENMYFMRTSSSAGKVAFPAETDSWYNEITSFQPSQILPYVFTSGTGHFSQVAWAQTTRIGCGYTWEYNTTLSATFSYVHYVVCNYAYGGNIQTSSMYKSGTPCTSCESGLCDTTYPNLCLPGAGQFLIEESSPDDQSPENFEVIRSEPVSQIQISETTQELEFQEQKSKHKHRKSHLKRNE